MSVRLWGEGEGEGSRTTGPARVLYCTIWLRVRVLHSTYDTGIPRVQVYKYSHRDWLEWGKEEKERKEKKKERKTKK